MAKDTQVQIRLSQELKEKLKQKGNMSGYIHGLIEKDLRLSEPLDPNDVAAAVRESGLPEATVREAGEAVRAEAAAVTGNPTQAEREALLPGETMKLKGQGMTTRVATQEAKRRLGL